MITTHGKTQFAPNLISSWNSYTILQSSQQSDLKASFNSSATDDYLKATLHDIQSINTHISGIITTTIDSNLQNKSIYEKIEIFDEFSLEVGTDLEMKHATIKSREMFVTAYMTCFQQLIGVPPKLVNLKQPELQKTDKYNTFTNSAGGIIPDRIYSRAKSTGRRNSLSIHNTLENKNEESTSEMQIRLHDTAFHRLLLIQAAMKVSNPRNLI